MSGPSNETKCAISEAYLHALAAVTGFPCVIGVRPLDALKIDAQFTVVRDFGPDAKRNLLTLYVQLKATWEDFGWKRGKGKYVLKDIDLYNQFRTTKTREPMLLVLLELPKKHQESNWFACTPQALSLKCCAYWVSLYDAPAVTTTSVTLTVLKKNRLSDKSLTQFIRNFATTEMPVPYET